MQGALKYMQAPKPYLVLHPGEPDWLCFFDFSLKCRLEDCLSYLSYTSFFWSWTPTLDLLNQNLLI